MKSETVAEESAKDEGEKEVNGSFCFRGHQGAYGQGEKSKNDEDLVFEVGRPTRAKSEASGSADRHGDGVEECADHAPKLPLGFEGLDSQRGRSSTSTR